MKYVKTLVTLTLAAALSLAVLLTWAPLIWSGKDKDNAADTRSAGRGVCRAGRMGDAVRWTELPWAGAVRKDLKSEYCVYIKLRARYYSRTLNQ